MLITTHDDGQRMGQPKPFKAGDFVRIHNGGGRGRVVAVRVIIASDQGGHVSEDPSNVEHLRSTEHPSNVCCEEAWCPRHGNIGERT